VTISSFAYFDLLQSVALFNSELNGLSALKKKKKRKENSFDSDLEFKITATNYTVVCMTTRSKFARTHTNDFKLHFRAF